MEPSTIKHNLSDADSAIACSCCSGCGKFVEDSWRIFCRGHRDSKSESPRERPFVTRLNNCWSYSLSHCVNAFGQLHTRSTACVPNQQQADPTLCTGCAWWDVRVDPVTLYCQSHKPLVTACVATCRCCGCQPQGVSSVAHASDAPQYRRHSKEGVQQCTTQAAAHD